MDTRFRQPGVSRGRGVVGAQGRGSSRDSFGSAGSLPPINDRSISKEAVLPRAASGRARSMEKGSICRDNSLPPLLQPCSSVDVLESRQNTSVRPPRPQASQRSQSHTSARNQEPFQQQQSLEHGRNGSRATRPPRDPQAEITPPSARTRSGSQQRTSSPLARAERKGSNQRQVDNTEASPREKRLGKNSRARQSPAVPAISSQDSPTERPASPPIPTLASAPAMGMEDIERATDVILVPCRHCGRKFRPEAKARHESICVKVFQKERKQFKAVEQRAPAEALQLQKEAKRTQRREGNKSKPGQNVQNQASNNWRAKSEAFRSAIKESRVISRYQREGRDLRDLPPPKSLPPELDDRVPCPHCGRRFGQQQAERHIPQCKNTKARPNGILRAHAAAPKPKSRR